jgi:hypothetical protein
MTTIIEHLGSAAGAGQEPATNTIPCPFCKTGWVLVPDSYGCVEWDECFDCKGSGRIEKLG